MRILRDDSIALCIDIQDRLFPHIEEPIDLESRCVRLIQGLQICSVPIVVTEQYRKGLGSTILSVQESLSRFEPLEKMCFSCADDSSIAAELTSSGKHTVIVFGIEAHVCVLQTVLDLIELKFQPVVIADCIGSRSVLDKSIAIDRMRAEGAIISSCESILFELCRVSGTPTFKQISQLVK